MSCIKFFLENVAENNRVTRGDESKSRLTIVRDAQRRLADKFRILSRNVLARADSSYLRKRIHDEPEKYIRAAAFEIFIIAEFSRDLCFSAFYN